MDAERPTESSTALAVPAEQFNAHEHAIVDNVRDHGFFAFQVGDEKLEPTYSYTIGWWLNAGHPDIILYNLPIEAAHAAFWGAWRWVQANGPLPIAQPISGIGPTDCYLMPVIDEARLDHMTSCRWFYRRDDFPAVHLIWTDEAGLPPWAEGFDRRYLGAQPDISAEGWRAILGLPDLPPPPRRSLWDRLTGRD